MKHHKNVFIYSNFNSIFWIFIHLTIVTKESCPAASINLQLFSHLNAAK